MSTSICYESVYPWMSRAFVANGSELLATITNDAWFGTSSAAYQHLEQGAIRAVEEGRYMVRAANTGICGAVDPYGRVLVEDASSSSRPRSSSTSACSTAATIYNRIGDWVVWISLVLTAGLIFWCCAMAPRKN